MHDWNCPNNVAQASNSTNFLLVVGCYIWRLKTRSENKTFLQTWFPLCRNCSEQVISPIRNSLDVNLSTFSVFKSVIVDGTNVGMFHYISHLTWSRQLRQSGNQALPCRCAIFTCLTYNWLEHTSPTHDISTQIHRLYPRKVWHILIWIWLTYHFIKLSTWQLRWRHTIPQVMMTGPPFLICEIKYNIRCNISSRVAACSNKEILAERWP